MSKKAYKKVLLRKKVFALPKVIRTRFGTIVLHALYADRQNAPIRTARNGKRQ